jgi:hypothetical protein
MLGEGVRLSGITVGHDYMNSPSIPDASSDWLINKKTFGCLLHSPSELFPIGRICRSIFHCPLCCSCSCSARGAPQLLLRCQPRPTMPTGAASARRSVGPWRGSPLALPPVTTEARRCLNADGGGGHTAIRCMLQMYNSNVFVVLEVCCKCFIWML